MQQTYSDEHIEYWGAIYLGNRLMDYGILFETFLRYPQQIMQAMEGREFRPLLPRQVAVRQRIDRNSQPVRERKADMQVQLRSDHMIEPLHHRIWPKRRPCQQRRRAKV